MRRLSSLPLATAVSAALALCIVAPAASAGRLSISENQQVGGLVFNPLTLETGSFTGRCPMTLGGSFASRTITKTAGRRVGSVTAAGMTAACTGGGATVLQETLPWEANYNSFTGTLPNIAGVKLDLVGVGLRVEVSGTNCLLRTEARQPTRAIASLSAGSITAVRMEEAATIPLTGGFFCEFAGRAHFAGSATLGINGEMVRLTLI